MAVGKEVPEELRKVIHHARRLADVLLEMEHELPESTWACGRTREVQLMVSFVLKDWRTNVRTEKDATAYLADHLEVLHRGAARRLGKGASLECCRGCDRGNRGGSLLFPVITTMRAQPGYDAIEGTVRKAWKDGPEVLARVKEGLPVVEMCARTILPRVKDVCGFDDLQAFGLEGLLMAARMFDEEQDVPFAAWARMRVRAAMFDGVRYWGEVPRSVIRAIQKGSKRRHDGTSVLTLGSARIAAGVSAFQEQERDRMDAVGANPEEAVITSQVVDRARRVMPTLPAKEAELVARHIFGGETIEQAAEAMGMCKQWGGKLHARAMEKIRRAVMKRTG